MRIGMQTIVTSLSHFEYHLRDRMRVKNCAEQTDEFCQTGQQPKPKSTPDLRKRPREPTESSQETAAKKSEEKRLRASAKESDRVEVPVRKNLQKLKRKKNVETLEAKTRLTSCGARNARRGSELHRHSKLSLFRE